MAENGRKLSRRLNSTVVAAAIIFVVTLSIFLVSRIRQVADSAYSMLVSHSLLRHGSFALDRYIIPRHEPVWHGYYFKNGPVYQLEVTRGAASHATWLWNMRPLEIDEHPERLWDWSQPQFLAGILPPQPQAQASPQSSPPVVP